MSLQTRIAAHASAVAMIASDEGREEHLERRYSLGFKDPLFDFGIVEEPAPSNPRAKANPSVRQYRYTAVVRLHFGYVLVLERARDIADAPAGNWRPYHVSRV